MYRYHQHFWEQIEYFKDKNIVSIAYIGNSGFYIDTDGQLYGEVYFNGPGRRRVNPAMLIPYFVENKVIVSKICGGGDEHYLVLDNHGIVYSWGYNYLGRLGLGVEIKLIETPHIIETLKDYTIIDIKASHGISYAKSKRDHHFLWGDNSEGQCSLMRTNKPEQHVPLMINDIFYQLTRCKIECVCISYCQTYIVSQK